MSHRALHVSLQLDDVCIRHLMAMPTADRFEFANGALKQLLCERGIAPVADWADVASNDDA